MPAGSAHARGDGSGRGACETSRAPHRLPARRSVCAASIPQGPAVTATAALVALGSLGFALVNIIFEVSDRFADGPYAEYASGLTVMNWLVAGLKLVGAAVALLSVARRPRLVSPPVMAVLLWGAFATLGVYALGSVVQAIGMALGLMGSAAQIDVAGVAYVLASLLFAAGYGVLAISYARRHGLKRGSVVVGVLGGPRSWQRCCS